MNKVLRELPIRLQVAWLRLKHDERGAQTLEWLALALLVLAILGTVSVAVGDKGFGDTLKAKFMGMVDKIDK